MRPFLGDAPSDISVSPSLIGDGFGAADWISDSLEGLRFSLTIEDFLELLVGAACPDTAGDMALDGGNDEGVPT